MSYETPLVFVQISMVVEGDKLPGSNRLLDEAIEYLNKTSEDSFAPVLVGDKQCTNSTNNNGEKLYECVFGFLFDTGPDFVPLLERVGNNAMELKQWVIDNIILEDGWTKKGTQFWLEVTEATIPSYDDIERYNVEKWHRK